ncbi:hypothetical protein PI124_g19998 [Phytophthora idaei]|nr:hypothetical protein PI124_g19998 [Phytophthora idaei]
MNGWNQAASRTNKAHHALAKTATAEPKPFPKITDAEQQSRCGHRCSPRNRACSWISVMDSLSDTAQCGDSSLWSLLVRLSRSL